MKKMTRFNFCFATVICIILGLFTSNTNSQIDKRNNITKIDSVVISQMKMINSASVLINGKKHNIDFCIPEMEEDKVILINIFDKKKQNIILSIKREYFNYWSDRNG